MLIRMNSRSCVKYSTNLLFLQMEIRKSLAIVKENLFIEMTVATAKLTRLKNKTKVESIFD